MNYSIPVLIVNSKSNFSIKCIEKTVSSIQALSSSAKGKGRNPVGTVGLAIKSSPATTPT